MTCEVCGGELQIGDYPFCHGDPTQHGKRIAGVIGDECDLVQENGFHTPTRFTSKAALRDALAARGLEMRVRHVTVPGTDKSPHTTNWASGLPEEYLVGVKAMLERCAKEARGSSPTPAFQWPVSWATR